MIDGGFPHMLVGLPRIVAQRQREAKGQLGVPTECLTEYVSIAFFIEY